MKIVAFGASASKHSINKQFAYFTAKKMGVGIVELLDLNEYPLPLYTIDIENEQDIPNTVKEFAHILQRADLIVISLAEHNGSYTAVFKNLFDWLSRYDRKFFNGIPVVLLSTSPGERGGRSVMNSALKRFPLHGAKIIGHYSLPRFNDIFNSEKIMDEVDLDSDFDVFVNVVKEFFGNSL